MPLPGTKSRPQTEYPKINPKFLHMIPFQAALSEIAAAAPTDPLAAFEHLLFLARWVDYLGNSHEAPFGACSAAREALILSIRNCAALLKISTVAKLYGKSGAKYDDKDEVESDKEPQLDGETDSDLAALCIIIKDLPDFATAALGHYDEALTTYNWLGSFDEHQDTKLFSVPLGRWIRALEWQNAAEIAERAEQSRLSQESIDKAVADKAERVAEAQRQTELRKARRAEAKATLKRSGLSCGKPYWNSNRPLVPTRRKRALAMAGVGSRASSLYSIANRRRSTQEVQR